MTTIRNLAMITIIAGLFFGASDTESGQIWNTIGGAGLFTLIGIGIAAFVRGRRESQDTGR